MNDTYSITPDPSSIAGNSATFDLTNSELLVYSNLLLFNFKPVLGDGPLDVTMQWPSEFAYRQYLICIYLYLQSMIF